MNGVRATSAGNDSPSLPAAGGLVAEDRRAGTGRAPSARGRCHDLVQAASDELRVGQLEHLGRDLRAPADQAVGVDDHDRVRLRLEESAEAGFAGADGLGLVDGPGRMGEGGDRPFALDGPRRQGAEELDERDIVLQEQLPTAKVAP